jgi:hypothetical protein
MVKYWELNEFTTVSSMISSDNDHPKNIVFDKDGRHAFIIFNDCMKVYILDDIKPLMLDAIPK